MSFINSIKFMRMFLLLIGSLNFISSVSGMEISPAIINQEDFKSGIAANHAAGIFDGVRKVFVKEVRSVEDFKKLVTDRNYEQAYKVLSSFNENFEKTECIDFVAKDIVRILLSLDGGSFVQKIIENYPFNLASLSCEVMQKFERIVDNGLVGLWFKRLIESPIVDSRNFVEQIAKRYKAFLSIDSFFIQDIILFLMNKSNNVQSLFIEKTIENFDSILAMGRTTFILNIINQSNKDKYLFIEPVLRNFKKLYKDSVGRQIIRIMGLESISYDDGIEIADYLYDSVANFKKIIMKKGGIEILRILILARNDASKYIQSGAQAFNELLDTEAGQDLLTEIIVNAGDGVEVFIPLILANIARINDADQIVNALSKRFPANQDIKKLSFSAAYKIAKINGTKKILDTILYNSDGTLSDDICQTGQHLISNPQALASEVAIKFCKTPELIELFERLIAKEKELCKEYYTFYHSQRKVFYWPGKLYTMLWSMRYKKSVKDFYFAHLKDPLDPDNDDEYMEREVERVILMNTDPDDGFYEHRKFRDHLYNLILYTNYAFFANDCFTDSSSADILCKNYNWTHHNIHPRHSFNFLGYNSIYEKFSHEIDALYNDYNKLNQFGTALLVAVPKSKIQDYMYVGDFAGRKISLDIKGVGLTSDVKLIMETLLTHPERMPKSDRRMLVSGYPTSDRIEFQLVMFHKHGGLDPDTGIKIFPFLSGDAKKLAELAQREEVLMAKIKAAIQEEQKKIEEKAVDRAIRIAKHVVDVGSPEAVKAEATAARKKIIMNHLIHVNQK